MIPALLMRMSRRAVDEFTIWAALVIEVKEARSSSRKVMLAFGTTSFIFF